MTDTPDRDPVQRYADRIIAWVRQWDLDSPVGLQASFNSVTDGHYHGINVLILGGDMRARQCGP